MPLKISQSIIRVAERLLGLTGTPLPTDVRSDVQLIMETRALRPWELFDEGLIAADGFVLSPPVAAEFSYAMIGATLVGTTVNRNDFLVVTSFLPFAGAGTVTVRAGSTDAQAAGTSLMANVDLRVANPPGQIQQIFQGSGSNAAISGVIYRNNVPANIKYPCFYLLTPPTAATSPPQPNLSIWHNTVNTQLDVSFEGIWVPANR